MKNWLLTLIVIIVALTNTLTVTPVTPGASVEDSIVVPSETPAEVPAETPAEVPAETPAEVPAETPAEAPAETPAEAPAETPAEAPAETPAEAPAETPAEVPAETPAEAPAEAAADPRNILAAPVALFELCPGVETISMDFDDFTLSLPADTYGQQGAKANGQVMLVLYEAMPTGTSFTANLTVVWNSLGATYSDALVPSMAAATEKSYPQTISQLQQQGIAATNMRMLSATSGSIGNLPTVDLLTTYDADYSGMGVDLKTNLLVLQRTVLLGDKGLYVFNITAEDLSECVRLSSILDTLVWKE